MPALPAQNVAPSGAETIGGAAFPPSACWGLRAHVPDGALFLATELESEDA